MPGIDAREAAPQVPFGKHGALRGSGARMLAAGTRLPAGLHALAATVGGRLGPMLRGGVVYTDDCAPVEWLTDPSILQFVTGQR